VALQDGARTGNPAGHATATLAGPEEFARLADPFRAELLAHCYRMLGSVQDAEDQVQETYLRAWRSYGAFEGRASLRTWLHRIATNVCLTALDGRRRVPVPSGFPESDRDDGGPGPWQEAAAGARDGSDPDLTDPAAVLASREHRASALTVLWRHLSPRQRAVLVLRDVLGWQAIEIADLLGTSGAAVHSMVRRARAQLAQAPATVETGMPGMPNGTAERRLLDAYAAAFETGDIGAIVSLLADDAVCTQAVAGTVATGRAAILPLLARCPAFGECRMVPVTAGGRPGFGIYRRGEDGTYRAYMIDVLTVSRSGFKRIDVLEDRTLFATFGLPQVHPGGPDAA
jgi:RNA polymerase sigma-70 factor (ECF subfamily)